MPRLPGRLALLAALLSSVPCAAAEDSLPDGAIARIGTQCLRHAGAVANVVFAPDGKSLASGGKDGLVRLWETATGKEIHRFKGHLGDVVGLAFSADGTTLLSSGADSTVRFWDVATGQAGTTLLISPTSVNAATFAPDGKLFAAPDSARAVRVWNLDGKLLHVFPAAVGPDQSCMAFAQDGTMLALVGPDGGLRLMDTATGKEVHGCVTHHTNVYSLHFSHDRKLLASAGGDGAVRVWDVATGKELRKIKGHDGGGTCVRFSPDGKVLASCGADRTVRLWEVETGKELRRLAGPAVAAAVAVAFSPDGKVLATAGEDWAVRLWSPATGKELPQSATSMTVECAALSADGKVMATGHSDGRVRFWDPSTGKPLPGGAGAGGPVIAVALSADGGVVAAGTRAGGFGAWEPDTGKRRFAVTGALVSALVLSPDGKTLVVTRDSSESPAFFDARTGKPKPSPLPDRDPPLARWLDGPYGFVFSPDGRWIVTASHSEPVRIYDARRVADGRPLPVRPVGWGARVSFAPGGRSFVTAVPGKSVQLWETASARERRSWPSKGESSDIVAVSGNGRLVAGTGVDGVVQVWDAFSGQALRRFRGHDNPVTFLAFAADGKLVSVSAEGTALIWDTAGLKRKAAGRPGKIDAAAWEALADPEADKAFETMGRLDESSVAALGLLRERLKPARAVDGKRIPLLIAQLDDDDFDKREMASRELEKLGNRAEEALRQAEQATHSAEVARRAGDLLKKIESPGNSGNRLREIRALEVLEGLGTPEAKKLLEELADGAPDASLTREAKASLGRLAKRP